MQPNRPITYSNESPTIQIIIVIIALTLFSNGYCFSQSNQKGKTMNTTKNNVKTKNAASVYIDKNDPIFISIINRAVDDLKQSVERADPESTENKLIAAQMKTWTREKLNKLQTLFEKSINDYTAQTHFDAGTFMLVFRELGKMDRKKIVEEYEIRIQIIGSNKYAAEFWEDGLAVNSEENAVAYANELANSEYAKKHPDEGVGNVEEAKETYANVRKSIKDGKQERYTKVMALLYTKEKDGSITFREPFQPVIDFVKK